MADNLYRNTLCIKTNFDILQIINSLFKIINYFNIVTNILNKESRT